MLIDEGASINQHLDLSLSKRISIKTNEDFIKEYDLAVNEKLEVLRLVVQGYTEVLDKD